jgi:hypothetical protein
MGKIKLTLGEDLVSRAHTPGLVRLIRATIRSEVAGSIPAGSIQTIV